MICYGILKVQTLVVSANGVCLKDWYLLADFAVFFLTSGWNMMEPKEVDPHVWSSEICGRWCSATKNTPGEGDYYDYLFQSGNLHCKNTSLLQDIFSAPKVEHCWKGAAWDVTQAKYSSKFGTWTHTFLQQFVAPRRQNPIPNWPIRVPHQDQFLVVWFKLSSYAETSKWTNHQRWSDIWELPSATARHPMETQQAHLWSGCCT